MGALACTSRALSIAARALASAETPRARPRARIDEPRARERARPGARVSPPRGISRGSNPSAIEG